MESETGLFALHSTLIGSAVRVESKDLTYATGVLYCIDPESDSVVLLSAQDDNSNEHGDKKSWSVKIFLGQSVVAIHADDQATAADAAGETLESIRESLCASQGAKEGDREDDDRAALLHRREQLCTFLRQRFIPCEESDSAAASVVVFGGVARILTPFTCESIECASEQVLVRLQQLLRGSEFEF